MMPIPGQQVAWPSKEVDEIKASSCSWMAFKCYLFSNATWNALASAGRDKPSQRQFTRFNHERYCARLLDSCIERVGKKLALALLAASPGLLTYQPSLF
eukprot:6193004-Pleurochrysis_carterae.AAC.13